MSSDARKRAEEALATMNGVLLAWGPQPPMSDSAALCHAISVGTVALEALLASKPAPPAGAEVREAAERLRRARESNFLTCTDSRVRAEGNRVLLLEVDALLATLATVTVPAGVAGPDDPIRVRLVPDDAAVREAAEVIRTILTAHDARLSESGALTYGPPSKGTGFVAAIQWLRRYDAARGGE